MIIKYINHVQIKIICEIKDLSLTEILMHYINR